MSLHNSPGSRTILHERKIDTMNVTERLMGVCWTSLSAGKPHLLTSKIHVIAAIVSLLSGP